MLDGAPRRPTARRAMPSLALALAGLLGACRTVPATQVLVFFHAQPETVPTGASLRVQVTSAEGEPVLDRTDPVTASSVGWLARVPVVPVEGDASRRFRVVGVLLDGEGDELVRASANLGYERQELLEAHLWLDDSCAGVTCPEGQTCSAGLCVGDCFDAEPAGVGRSAPLCGECEVCSAGACAPRPTGTPCGCPGDVCNSAGSCEVQAQVIEVFAGGFADDELAFGHTCAEVSGRGLWCWGDNAMGQLGLPSTTGASSPQPVPVTVFRPMSGTAGARHSCFTDVSNRATCFGGNADGEIGIGESGAEPVEPSRVMGPTLRGLSAGWDFTCGLGLEGEEAGRVLCWGNNMFGALGEDRASALVPRELALPAGRFVTVAAGGYHACAIRDDGRVFCWGYNNSGEVGTGATAPEVGTAVETACIDGTCRDDWTALGLGGFHSCGIRAGGELWCWGGNLLGQLGRPAEGNFAAAERVPGGPYQRVAAGRSHTCALHVNGQIFCWGASEQGQVGSGSLLTSNVTPAEVALPPTAPVRAMALGARHSCAALADGSLWCWGDNTSGQLGLGDDAPAIVPTPRRVCFPPG